MRHVVERTDHRRDIPERGAFHSSFTDRLLRIAFEVDDHEVIARVQQLTQVIIAVAPNAPADERLVDKSAESVE